MLILGLNAYHGDSSACILNNGELLAAVEEERFRRVKHWAGFPSESIKYCLEVAKADIGELDYIAINRNPKANLFKKILFASSKKPFNFIKDRLNNALKVGRIKEVIGQEFNIKPQKIKAKIYNVEHHIAHLTSTFFVSPFENAVIVSVDGFGDFVGAMWGIGRNNNIETKDRIYFPHSLGIFYLAFTQYLGFPNYGDEYKVMGLAAFGEPTEIDKMNKIVKINYGFNFELNPEYFIHHSAGTIMTWKSGEPKMEPLYSPELEELLGPARKKDETITSHHENIAASLQSMYEKSFFHLLNYIFENTKISTLCLSGGCAMNSVANGKIFDKTPFKDVYIQAAAGDAGGAIGAAYYVYFQILGQSKNFVMDNVYFGPAFDNDTIKTTIEARRAELSKIGCNIEKILLDSELCRKIAAKIAEGKVVGWYQGRMEWGSRALGNRSILADPRRSEMQDVLNAVIKRRESFRPFAPSILLEKVSEYFEKDHPDPFMMKVYPIKKEKRNVIPAVTHVDGTGRLQTVTEKENPLYWKLISEFEKITGVPVLLNTSFNENEPIVCMPEEALDCFLRTKMDILVLGNWVIMRT